MTPKNAMPLTYLRIFVFILILEENRKYHSINRKLSFFPPNGLDENDLPPTSPPKNKPSTTVSLVREEEAASSEKLPQGPLPIFFFEFWMIDKSVFSGGNGLFRRRRRGVSDV